MLTEERYNIITETVNKNKSVTINDLCDLLGASVSTVRRDLNALHEMGRITKVHGGAVSLTESFNQHERDVEEKIWLNSVEKTMVAKYAASLIEDGDFVFIDAGTTTEKMIDFLPQKNVIFVTNGFIHARKLAQKGFRVFIPGGEIKLSTEAIVGAECVLSLQNYNFTKSFIGVNGISYSAELTTPDVNEAKVKTAVIKKSRRSFVLADNTKFDVVFPVTFATFGNVTIITDKVKDKQYHNAADIKEVM